MGSPLADSFKGVTGIEEIGIDESGFCGIFGISGTLVGVGLLSCCCCGGGVETGSALAAVGLGEEVGAELEAASPAPTFILTIGKFAVTAEPSSTSKDSITPAFGAFISIVVLSVSILAIISSSLTLSPGFFSNVISPSLIDSAKVGVSIVIISSFK